MYMDALALVGVIRMRPAGTERYRVHLQHIPGLRLLQDEFEAAFFSAGKIAIDQVRAIGPFCTARGRAKLRQLGRILSVLRVILCFRRMDRVDGFGGGRIFGQGTCSLLVYDVREASTVQTASAARRALSIRSILRRNFGNALSRSALAPSDRAFSGSSWNSTKMPEMPVATAAAARGSMNCGCPPETPPELLGS